MSSYKIFYPEQINTNLLIELLVVCPAPPHESIVSSFWLLRIPRPALLLRVLRLAPLHPRSGSSVSPVRLLRSASCPCPLPCKYNYEMKIRAGTVAILANFNNWLQPL